MSASPYDVILRPVVSEKTTMVKETENTVVFEVQKQATKAEIKQAVEKVFDVKVASVRTVVVRGKDKRVGKSAGRSRNWKKAYVKLGEGQKIELFEGV
jgi:large subunit ribosomal protein L23